MDLAVALQGAPAATLMETLRINTRPAHQRLEHDLDILAATLSKPRMTAILTRFYGFYAVWEPAVDGIAAMRSAVVDRAKLPLLAQDLRSLCGDAFVPDAIPRCSDAAALCASPGRALGACYVIEGSTLGGQVITRAVRATPWCPATGLSFFDPYGARTGAMWSEFKRWANAAPRSTWAEIEQGANECFALMHRWLTPGLPA